MESEAAVFSFSFPLEASGKLFGMAAARVLKTGCMTERK